MSADTRFEVLPWSASDPLELSRVKGVCLDIDDTLSSDGKLTAGAYQALWRLKTTGLAVVPVTGRPAGWCDQIARFWPVDAVVGENGAFTFYVDRKATPNVRRRIETPMGALTPGDAKKKLADLEKDILKKFPEAKRASDQSYREFDLAIDICEDVPAWEKPRVKELLSFCKDKGAHAKLSSIHVNIWFGEYDKRKGLEHWLSQGAPGLSSKAPPKWEEWLYIGDSPNDEPLFAAFPYTVGVANLAPYLETLVSPPRWMTLQESGAGFEEMAERLIRARSTH